MHNLQEHVLEVCGLTTVEDVYHWSVPIIGKLNAEKLKEMEIDGKALASPWEWIKKFEVITRKKKILLGLSQLKTNFISLPQGEKFWKFVYFLVNERDISTIKENEFTGGKPSSGKKHLVQEMAF